MPRWLRFSSKALLTMGVFVALALAVDPSTLLSSLRNANGLWIGGALLLLPLNLTLDGWVWKRLLEPVVDRVPVRTLVGAVLSGIALGFWTPARAGEYAGRAFSLPTGDRWTISLTVFAQRMVDMTIGVLVGLLALAWAFWQGILPLTLAWGAAAAIGLGSGAVLTALVVAPARVHHCVQWLFPNRPGLTDRTAFFERLSVRHGGAVVVGSLARYLVFTTQFACLGMAVAPAGAWPSMALAGGLTFYAKYLIPSLTLLDLGIREGSAVFFFQQLGLGAAAGLNAALLLFGINVLLPALLGLPFLMRLHLPGIADRSGTPASVSPAQQ